jgi:hypothetical protein
MLFGPGCRFPVTYAAAEPYREKSFAKHAGGAFNSGSLGAK